MSYESLKKNHPELNWEEAEEVSDDELSATAEYFDRIVEEVREAKKLMIDKLQHSWTATVTLNNGKDIDIWYTSWPSIRSTVKRVKTISSDLPRHIINK